VYISIIVFFLVGILSAYVLLFGVHNPLQKNLVTIQVINKNPEINVGLSTVSDQPELEQRLHDVLTKWQITSIVVTSVDNPYLTIKYSWDTGTDTPIYSAYTAEPISDHTLSILMYVNAPLMKKYRWKTSQVENEFETSFIRAILAEDGLQKNDHTPQNMLADIRHSVAGSLFSVSYSTQ